MKSILKLIVLSLLSITMLFAATSCEKKEDNSNDNSSKATTSSIDENLPKIWSSATYTSDTELGEGDKKVEVEVKAEEKSVTFTIHTDKSTLADALTDLKLIKGDDSEYGIFITEVNGITADYNENKSYWMISKDGVSLSVGADSTKIADGEHYEFTYTKE